MWCNFFDGCLFELGLGRNMYKLVLCFGCSMFLYVNGLVFSLMYLGWLDLWVLLFEGEDGVVVFNFGLGNEVWYFGIVVGLNVVWVMYVVGWLVVGMCIVV